MFSYLLMCNLYNRRGLGSVFRIARNGSSRNCLFAKYVNLPKKFSVLDLPYFRSLVDSNRPKPKNIVLIF